MTIGKMYQIGIKITKFVLKKYLKKYLQVTISTRKYLLPRVLKISLMKVTKVTTKKAMCWKSTCKYPEVPGTTCPNGYSKWAWYCSNTLLKSVGAKSYQIGIYYTEFVSNRYCNWLNVPKGSYTHGYSINSLILMN